MLVQIFVFNWINLTIYTVAKLRVPLNKFKMILTCRFDDFSVVLLRKSLDIKV